MKIMIFEEASAGGIRRATQELARALRRRSILVEILSKKEPKPSSLAGQIQAFKRSSFKALPWAHQIDRRKCDVVLVQQFQFGAPPTLKYLKTPSIYYCQEAPRAIYDLHATTVPRPAFFPKEAFGLAKAAPAAWKAHLRHIQKEDRATVRCANSVLTNSKRSQAALQAAYQKRPHLCYLGVSEKYFRPGRGRRRQNTVLSVGLYGPHKGFDLLIRAAAFLPPERRPELWLAGYDAVATYTRYLRHLARFVGVRLKLYENISDAKLLRLYRTASVFCFAPIREPFGLVVLEAMSCELPVVVVDEAGASEAIRHNQTGLITPRTPKALSQAMEELLTHPGKARQMAQAARASILESWTWDHAAEKLLRVCGR